MLFNKKILFLFLLCSGSIACKQVNIEQTGDSFDSSLVIVEEDDLKLIPEKGLMYYHDQPFSGKAIRYDDHRALVSEATYVKGKKHGVLRKYFEKGVLSFESQYIDGKQDGTATSWWKNGEVRSVSKFEKGIPHGEQWQWYKSGAKFKRTNLVYGKEEGIQQSWRENGKIYNNYEAKNGRVFGLKRSKLCYELDKEEIQIND